MPSELQAEWGRRLRIRRKELGLSLREISSQAGISKTHYCRLEAGQNAPRTDLRLKLAAALNLQVEEIFWHPDTTS